MRIPLARRALATVTIVAACATAGCSHGYPRSPVPAQLTEREAAYLGERYLDERGVPARLVTHFEPTQTGHLFHYATLFDPPATPPKQVRLLNIHDDGTVREVWFNEND
ncbi:MAG TPA: hypothetical protein VER17_17695 [Tepidisphaeraceae bacterium]|nr:hypothetical protein [Tepidisphaeraceae bacterium]